MSATQNEILNGGRVLTVKKSNGQPEQVKVRLLPIRALQRYAERVNDLAACAELFCDKHEGWADGIEHEGIFLIVEEGERLNQSPFDELLKRQKARNLRLAQQAGIPIPAELQPKPEAETTAFPVSSPEPASPAA